MGKKILAISLASLLWFGLTSALRGTFVSSLSPSFSRSHTRTKSCLARGPRERRFAGHVKASIRKRQIRPANRRRDLLAELHAAGHKGNLTGAEKVFHLLRLPCPSDVEFHVSTQTINALILAAANSGNVERALAWFDQLLTFELDPDMSCFTSVISAGAKYGNVSFAEEWFEAMGYHGINADVTAYGAVMHAAANAGKPALAEKWFQRMKEQHIQANQVTYTHAPWPGCIMWLNLPGGLTS